MRGVEFTCFLTGISSKLTDKVLIDETEHVITLTVIGRDVLDEREQIEDGFRLLSGCRTEFVDSRTEGREDFLEELLVVLVDQSFERREGDGDVLDAEIIAHLEPRRKEVVVRNEIADVRLAETYNLVVLLL